MTLSSHHQHSALSALSTQRSALMHSHLSIIIIFSRFQTAAQSRPQFLGPQAEESRGRCGGSGEWSWGRGHAARHPIQMGIVGGIRGGRRFLGGRKVPETAELDSAAALPLASLAVVQSLKELEEPEGKNILIHAGAGGVGTFAIQYAKNVPGTHVTATTSKGKAGIVEELGADLAIDYKSQDFTKVVKDYDAILDPVSFLYEGRTFESDVLKKTGHCLSIMSSDWALTEDGKEKSNGAGTYWNVFKHKLANLTIAPGRFVPKYDVCMVHPNGDDLQLAVDLLEENKVKAVIDSEFPLDDTAKAHRHLEGGHVAGKVVIQH